MQEVPTITGLSYGSAINNFALQNMSAGWNAGIPDQLAAYRELVPNAAVFYNDQSQEKEIQQMSTRRIVRVIIMDPNENVPMDKAVLFDSDEKFTDLTDQELFFESPIVEKLKAHNEVRKTTRDKDASREAGKDIFLEEAKIRHLKMVVITVAGF